MIDQSPGRQAGGAPAGASWPVRSGRIPACIGFHTARPETGYGLDESLFSSGGVRRPGTGGQVTVLVGPGGYGKTHLAAVVAEAAARSGLTDLVAWIDASSRPAVLAGYARAAGDIGLTDRGMLPDAAAARFADWLGRSDRPWLVVLDNAADLTGLRGVWPSGPAGEVLVTCPPSADLGELAAFSPRVCRIGEFSPREALGYLTARLYDDMDQRVQAIDLAADLAYLPLALALATATMSGTSLSCREYRLRVASRRQELLGRSADGTTSPIEVASSLAVDRADQRQPAGLARPLLSLTALLDPGGIPVRLLTTKAVIRYLEGRGAGPAADQRQIWPAIDSLSRSGLVSIDQPAGPGLITVHPAVQAATRKLVPAAVIEEAARAVADGMDEIWDEAAADPAIMRALYACAAGLADASGKVLWLPVPHRLLTRARTGALDSVVALPAVACWQSLLRACTRVLGPEHAQTLDIRDCLAAACEAAGQLNDATELTGVSVAERERLQGSGHPDTVATRAALARAYRAAGMPQEAIDLYQRVVADREWMLGADHPDTLAARSQLASACHFAGQYDQAAVHYQRNLAEWERLYGPDHHDTLTEYANLGRVYQSAGQYDDAIRVFRRVQSVGEKSQGTDHPDTLTACANLAYAYRCAGRLKEAIPFYRRALEGRQSVLGRDHPDTLTACANLAGCYHAAHRMKDAIALHERLLADRERISGADHPDTLTARGNLASAYHSAGRLVDALPVYERTVTDFERVLGPDHQDTLTSRANLAHAYYMARRLTDAMALFRRTLADCERVLGPAHPLTQAIRENVDAVSR